MKTSLIEQLESRLFMTGVVSGDFTGDGRVDIVTTQGGLKLRVGTGNGNFRAGVPINGTGFARGGSVAAADFNNDGSLDLAVFGGKSAASALKKAIGTRVVNGGLFVLLNNGDGTFQPAFSVNSGFINSGRIVGGAVTASDFNLDGNQDILVTNAASSTTPTTFNTGSGFVAGTTFTNPVTTGFFATNGGLSSPTGGNLLGTGTTNLLGGMNGGGGFIGTTGTFTTGVSGAAAAPVPAGTIGPAEAGSAPGSVAFVMDGNGNGTFQTPRRIALT